MPSRTPAEKRESCQAAASTPCRLTAIEPSVALSRTPVPFSGSCVPSAIACAMMMGADHVTPLSVERMTASVGLGLNSVKKLIQRAAGQNDDLVIERLEIGAGVENRARRFPRCATIGRAGEVRRAEIAGESVPHRIYKPRVGRVGGDRFLVIEGLGPVADQRDRVAPGDAAIRGAADQDGADGARLVFLPDE